MKIINTSGITASAGYPLLANNPNAMVGLDFIQSLIADIVTRYGVAIDNQRFANPVILNGLVLSGNTISAGSIYWNGEIYIWNAPNGGLITGTPAAYVACNVLLDPTDASPNQTVLSDGSLVSIHNQRTLTFFYSSTPNSGNLGAGNPDYGSFVPTQIAVNANNIAALTPGAWVNFSGGYKNSWGDAGTPFNQGRYRKEGNYVVLSGAIQGGVNGTVCFTLPVGYRPLNNCDFLIGAYNVGSIYACFITVASSGDITVYFPSGPNNLTLEGVRIPLT